MNAFTKDYTNTNTSGEKLRRQHTRSHEQRSDCILRYTYKLKSASILQDPQDCDQSFTLLSCMQSPCIPTKQMVGTL